MTYCNCETPVMDIDYDAGCRRCGRPVDFSPKSGLLDQLASLARTALDDPGALPDERYALASLEGPNAGPQIGYALDKLDAIINTLNPEELNRQNAAQALRVLGRHCAEIEDRLENGPGDTSGGAPFVPAIWQKAADAIAAALDCIDSAIDTLEDEDEPDDLPCYCGEQDCPRCGTA